MVRVLLTLSLLLLSFGTAHAVALTIHVHFENFGASGQQPGEADLVGWRVSLQTPAGAPVATLGVTQANGDTLPYELPGGTYKVVLALPDPSPYDVGAVWPNPLEFPMNVPGNAQNYRFRIGLGCGCNDGQTCTADICDAGICSTRPNLKPELPELCDRVDNDCDGQVDEGLPSPCNGNPPAVVGCSDGTREGFMDLARYPFIAACGGAWDQPGLDGPALAPACNRVTGNHSTNRAGAGCRAADLCAAGWHVCRGPADLSSRNATCADAVDPFYANYATGDFANNLTPPPGGAFFVGRGVFANNACRDAVNGLPSNAPTTNNLFGCGNLGASDHRCGPFDRGAGAGCGSLRDQFGNAADNPATDWGYDTANDWSWACSGGNDRNQLTKRFGDRQGGVLCCRDAAPGIAEVCDGIDNDADGLTDELAQGTLGASCPLGPQCGVFECTTDGGLVCEDPRPCDDSSCNGLDDDDDGATDEEFEPADTVCGVGVCARTGVLTCDDGSPEDSCVPGPRAEDSDLTCDGLDGDCDGATDEDWVDQQITCGEGVCEASGIRRCDNGMPVTTCTQRPPLSSTDTTCNGLDDDCNGAEDDGWNAQPTSCGQGACAATGAFACIGGTPTNTCVPGTPATNVDITCDRVDDDCDSQTDEDFEPIESTCGQGACTATGIITCDGDAHDTCEPLPATDDEDLACDGIDFDCDGVTDEDYVGMTITCGQGACLRSGTTACEGGEVGDACTPGEPALDDATCDGQDDDCDGLTDEDFEPGPTTCGLGACVGNVGFGTCDDGVLDDTCDPLDGAKAETCNDEDDDCDGEVDEDFGDLGEACDGDDDDACRTGVLTCAANGRAAECDEEDSYVDVCNGLDDDCDGDTDEGLASCDDGDGDGVPDPIDNCPSRANTDQADRDEDGLGDPCDLLAQGAGGDCSGGLNSALATVLGALVMLRRRWTRQQTDATVLTCSDGQPSGSAVNGSPPHMKEYTLKRFTWMLVAVALAACGDDGDNSKLDATEASPDATAETLADGAAETTEDTTAEASEDTTAEASEDTTAEASEDTTAEANEDTGIGDDATSGTGADTEVDGTQSFVVAAAEGATIALEGVTLEIPPGALSADTTITATALVTEDQPGHVDIAAQVWDFGPDGLTFLQPVTLTFDADLSAQGDRQATVAYLDGDAWVAVPSTVSGSSVSGETNHFTPFTVVFADDGQSAGACESIDGCGGDLVGNWTYEAGCLTLANPPSLDFCPEAIITAELDVIGSVAFNADKSVVANGEASIIMTMTVPKSCLPEGVPCEAIAATAIDVGDACVNTDTQVDPMDDLGTFEVAGTTITFTDDEGEVDTGPYCVRDDGATLVLVGEEGDIVRYELTRAP